MTTSPATPNPAEELVEAISARLHVTTDRIQGAWLKSGLSADTSAVHEAVEAVLVAGWKSPGEVAARERAVAEGIARAIETSPDHTSSAYAIAWGKAAATIARNYSKGPTDDDQ